MTEEETARRGRPRVRRTLHGDLSGRCFAPCWTENGQVETVSLRREDLEILRLVDLVGLDQEEAASLIGVSRRTLWRDLHEARKKVVDALVNGKAIEIEGCMLERGVFCQQQRRRRRGGGREPFAGRDSSLYFYSYE